MKTDEVTATNISDSTDDASLDTATQYLGMKDKDGSRSIVELHDLELKDGYSGMTDAEIAKLVRYHESVARRDETIRLQEESIRAQQERLAESLRKQEEYADAMFAKIIGMMPSFNTVTGNEVN